MYVSIFISGYGTFHRSLNKSKFLQVSGILLTILGDISNVIV